MECNKCRVNHSTKVERQQNFINNPLFSDVKFTFKWKDEITEIFAHKFWLSCVSNVFYTMFNGSIELQENSIEISDIDVNDFLQMLSYMYVEKVDLNESNVYGIMYAAHKYEISGLEELCTKFKLENFEVNRSNVCQLYGEHHIFDDEFTETCLLFIDNEFDVISNSNDFLKLPKSAIMSIMKRDSLCVNENNLLEKVLLWADKACEDDGVDQTIKNQMKKLNRLSLIRFPVMSPDEFADCCSSYTNMLTSDEIFDIFQFISTGRRNDSLRFSTKKREISRQFIFSLLTKYPIRFKEKYFLTFTVTADLILRKFTLKDTNCKIKLRQNDIVLYRNGIDNNGKWISCTPPVLLKSKQEYILETTIMTTNYPIVAHLFKVDDLNGPFLFDGVGHTHLERMHYYVIENP